MSDLKDLLSRASSRARGEYDRTQRPKLVDLKREVLRRTRRRRLLKHLVGSFGVLSIVLVLTMPLSVERSEMRVGRGMTVASAGDQGPTEWGFWPFVRRDLSEHVCGSSVLQGSEKAAIGFAESMLGWSNVVVVGENRYGDRVTSTIAELPSLFTGEPLPPRPVIKLQLERLRSENCWWVTGVSDPDDGASLSADVEDGELHVSFRLIPGSTRADVVVVEASNNLRRYVYGEAGRTSADINGFRGPGFVIVLWKGSDGRVMSAAGMTLNEGDSSTRLL